MLMIIPELRLAWEKAEDAKHFAYHAFHDKGFTHFGKPCPNTQGLDMDYTVTMAALELQLCEARLAYTKATDALRQVLSIQKESPC